MKRFLTWMRHRFSSSDEIYDTDLRQTGATTSPPQVGVRSLEDRPSHGRKFAPDYSPDKKNLVRNRMLREDNGTHDNLKILDDSILKTDEDDWVDPYNTGKFDRSKSWDRRSRQ